MGGKAPHKNHVCEDTPRQEEQYSRPPVYTIFLKQITGIP